MTGGRARTTFTSKAEGPSSERPLVLPQIMARFLTRNRDQRKNQEASPAAFLTALLLTCLCLTTFFIDFVAFAGAEAAG